MLLYTWLLCDSYNYVYCVCTQTLCAPTATNTGVSDQGSGLFNNQHLCKLCLCARRAQLVLQLDQINSTNMTRCVENVAGFASLVVAALQLGQPAAGTLAAADTLAVDWGLNLHASPAACQAACPAGSPSSPAAVALPAVVHTAAVAGCHTPARLVGTPQAIPPSWWAC